MGQDFGPSREAVANEPVGSGVWPSALRTVPTHVAMMGLMKRALGLLSTFAVVAAATSTAHADEIAGHTVQLDAEGKLLAWYVPQERAFDHVMRLSWHFLRDWPRVEENGLKTYLAYPTFNQTTLAGGHYPNIPAGHHAMSTDSAVRYFAYTGDPGDLAVMREMLDHHLAHGMSPAGWVYEKFPWASSDPGQVDYFGSSWCESKCGRGDGVGVTEPDKGAELGYAYLQAYEVTGDERYRDAAIAIGDTLARTRREGDATRSPWPFRVVSETGESKEEYASNYAGALMLFDELLRLGVGDGTAYRTARDALWAWLLAYPFQTKNWSGGFEDQEFYHDPAHDPTQYIVLKITQYLLERPEIDPEWRTHLADVIPWVESMFAVDTATEKGVQYGANVISEQKVFMVKMGNHTARYASVNALWHERTGDAPSREKAYRSLNWATYVCRPNGLVSFNPTYDEWWFATGYGDYVRNFMATLGAVPAFAPPRESHIVRSSSVVSSVTYEPTKVTFRTFHEKSIDVLRVGFMPTDITAGGRALVKRNDLEAEGYTVEDLGGGDFALRIRHEAGRDIVVTGIATSPDAGGPDGGASSPSPSPVTPLRAGGGGCGCSVGSEQWSTVSVLGPIGLLALRLRRRRKRPDGPGAA